VQQKIIMMRERETLEGKGNLLSGQLNGWMKVERDFGHFVVTDGPDYLPYYYRVML